MPTNNFKPFATGAGANAMSQAEWESLPALSTGFTTGKASSAQVNKALRQGASMASAVGQFVADSLGQDVLDDGNIAGLSTQIKNAVQANASGRLLNVRIFTTTGIYTPTTGTKSIIVDVIGGGGAGGGATTTSASQRSCGGGGSAGAYARARLTTGFAGVTVTIGSGGAGISATAGNSGGTTTFGSIISASGGGGGNTITTTTSDIASEGSPSNASGGNIVSSMGMGGLPGIVYSQALSASGRGGGSSLYLGGYGYGTRLDRDGYDATQFGCGGGGANNSPSMSTARKGGVGYSGVAIIYELG